MLYNTLQANKKLELQAREQENLTHYMAQLENHYQTSDGSNTIT